MNYLKYKGPSADGRTNKWGITCPKCGKEFTPITTRLAFDHVECPKCYAELSVDYNNEDVNLMETK